MDTPKSIALLDDFQALSKQEKYDCVARLSGIRSIAESLKDGSRFLDYPDFCELIDNLELDVSLIQEYGTRGLSGLSRWLTHHSWGLNSFRNMLHDDAQIAKAMTITLPTIHLTQDEYRNHFVELSQEILTMLTKLDSEIGEDKAISVLLCIDHLMCITLATCYRAAMAYI